MLFSCSLRFEVTWSITVWTSQGTCISVAKTTKKQTCIHFFSTCPFRKSLKNTVSQSTPPIWAGAMGRSNCNGWSSSRRGAVDKYSRTLDQRNSCANWKWLLIFLTFLAFGCRNFRHSFIAFSHICSRDNFVLWNKNPLTSTRKELVLTAVVQEGEIEVVMTSETSHGDIVFLSNSPIAMLCLSMVPFSSSDQHQRWANGTVDSLQSLQLQDVAAFWCILCIHFSASQAPLIFFFLPFRSESAHSSATSKSSATCFSSLRRSKVSCHKGQKHPQSRWSHA